MPKRGISCGGLSSRPSAEANGCGSSPSSTSPCSGCAPGLRAGSRKPLQADSDLAHLRQRPAASVEAVGKERAILEGLERIDGLQRENAPAEALLDAVRLLLSDAEEWVREDP